MLVFSLSLAARREHASDFEAGTLIPRKKLANQKVAPGPRMEVTSYGVSQLST